MPANQPTPPARAGRKAVPRNRLGAAGRVAAPRNRLGAAEWGAAPRNRLGRAAFVVLAGLLVAALGAPAASAADARYEASSADGGIVIFSTTDPLVPGDTDTRRDLYERSRDASAGNEYVTREVSFGPTGGNQAYDVQYAGSSANGKRVLFWTQESLVPADTDAAKDVYLRDLEANTTTLVSQGSASCAPGCGNAEVDAHFVLNGMAADGTKVFFSTTERLAPEDTDNSSDVYLRDLKPTPRRSSPRAAPPARRAAPTARTRSPSGRPRTAARRSS